MGAWGYQTFENDTAMGWLDELINSDGASRLEQTLLGESDDEAYLDSSRGVELLAASEIVYGLLYGPRKELPEAAVNWIRNHQQVDAACLKPVCERQLGRVLGEQSELHELWKADNDSYEQWRVHVETLQRGLTD